MICDLLAKEADTWTQFHFLYAGFVNDWIRRAGLGPNEAADVSQEVFYAVTESIDSYQHNKEKRGSFRAWLFGITRNKINDFLRKRARQAIAEGGERAQLKLSQIADNEKEAFQHETPAADSLSEEVWAHCDVSLVSKPLHVTIRTIQNDFGQQAWQVFWRVVVHGEMPSSVATDLGITSEAARQAKFRILKRIREELEVSS